MSRKVFAILLLFLLCLPLKARTRDDSGDKGIAASTSLLRFELIQSSERPIIDTSHPDDKDNHYGFEGGSVVKVGNLYHFFSSEMYGEPKSVAMRLAHWISPDAIHWKRLETLFETNGKDTGPRSSLWAPMPIYDLKDERWDLFYVAYEFARDGSEGRIWRAISKTPGPNGIGGPYDTGSVILQREPHAQTWEGYQGTDSFYPYRVKNHWYGFYGSHADEPFWKIGLVEAPHLEGPWTRLPQGNPLTIEPTFIENPIVTAVGASGDLYVAVYDSDTYSPTDAPTGGYSYQENHYVGYTYSKDGVHWAKGGRITVGATGWASDIRTPLCLIPEGGNVYTMLYTAQVKGASYWAVGYARLRLIRDTSPSP